MDSSRPSHGLLGSSMLATLGGANDEELRRLIRENEQLKQRLAMTQDAMDSLDVSLSGALTNVQNSMMGASSLAVSKLLSMVHE